MATFVGRRLRAGVAVGALVLGWSGGALADALDIYRTPEYQANWGLEAINAVEAYGRGLTGAGVLVAVVDGSAFLEHPDLAGRLLARESFVYQDTEALIAAMHNAGYSWPPDSHATHVAGTIGANRDGVGMHGVAPLVSMINADVFDLLPWEMYRDHPEVAASLLPTDQDRVFPDAIDAVVAAGAQIINGSYGSSGYGSHSIGPWAQAEYEAYQRAADAGVIMVFAAGNGYSPSEPLTNHPEVPALMPFIRPGNENSGLYEEIDGTYDFSGLEGMLVAVVATNSDNQIADFSNRCGVARDWCVAAPGVDIHSTIAPDAPDVTPEQAASGYGPMDGTSMATPHVSGALALMLEAFPGLDPRTIVKILFSTTDDLGAPGVDDIYGHGLINVGRATRGPTEFAGDWEMPVADGGNTVLSNGISGTGGLTKSGGGTLVLGGANTFTGATNVNGGTLYLHGTSTSSVTVGAGGTFGGTGTLNGGLNVQGSLAPGASPGVLTVGGPVVQGAASTFVAELDGTTAGNGAGFHDQLRVTGAGNTFTADGTLVPVLRGISAPATNTFTPTVGDRFVVVVAQGGIVGRFAAIAAPVGVSGLRMDTAYGANAITLIATPRAYANLGAAGLRESANTRAVGAVLDAQRPAAGSTGVGAARTMFTSLYGLRGAAVSSALDLASGSIHAEVGRGQTMARRDLTQALLDPAGAAERRVGSARVWANAVGGWTTVTGNDSGSGVSVDRAGFLGGIGVPLGEGGEVGVTFGYATTDLSQEDTPATADVTTWQAGVYGTWTLGATSLTATVAGGVDRADVTRPLAALGSAEASATVDGRGVSAGLEIAHRLSVDDGTIVRPALSLLGEAAWREGTSETGGGAWRLAVADGSTHRLTAMAAISGGREVEAAGMSFTPTVSLGLSHDLVRDDLDARATLQGRSFDAQAAQPGRTGLTLGLGVAADAGEGVSLGLSYGFEGRDDLRSHAARATVGVSW